MAWRVARLDYRQVSPPPPPPPPPTRRLPPSPVCLFRPEFVPAAWTSRAPPRPLLEPPSGQPGDRSASSTCPVSCWPCPAPPRSSPCSGQSRPCPSSPRPSDCNKTILGVWIHFDPTCTVLVPTQTQQSSFSTLRSPCSGRWRAIPDFCCPPPPTPPSSSHPPPPSTSDDFCGSNSTPSTTLTGR